ncbi:MAG: VanZ family protein [Saprospiraceae bacterium]
MKKIIAYLFIGMILLIFTGATTKSLGFIGQFVQSIPYGDKYIHFILIGTLAYVVNFLMGFRRFTLWNRKWLSGTTLIFIIMTIEEFSQMFISTRSFDLLDLSANYLGIFTATLIIILTNQKDIRTNVNNTAD